MLTLKAIAALYELDLEPEPLAGFTPLLLGDNGSMGDEPALLMKT